jgi:hypothetical protein
MLKISDILKELVEENKLNLKSRAKEQEDEALKYYSDKIINGKYFDLPENIFNKLSDDINIMNIRNKIKYEVFTNLKDYEFDIIPDDLKLEYIKMIKFMFDKPYFQNNWKKERKWYDEYKKRNNLSENINNSAEKSFASAKVSLSKANDTLRNLGVNFDRSGCSVVVGSIDDFLMNSYIRLINYGEKIMTPASRQTPKSSSTTETFNIYGTNFNFSKSTNTQQNQTPQIGEQITLSGVTFEWVGQQWNEVNLNKIWVDDNGLEATGKTIVLNTKYSINTSQNKILNYNGFDYIGTKAGWAIYNKNTGKSGLVITNNTKKPINQQTLHKAWIKQNPIPINFKVNYGGVDYTMTNKKTLKPTKYNQIVTNEWLNQKGNQNQQPQITNDTILDKVVLKGSQIKYVDCELEFYEFNSSDINQILTKNFNPKKINTGQPIKCKKTYYVKILRSNPRLINCEWGVIYITRIEKD